MRITDSFPKFYYEYYDSDGKLKSIEQDEFSNFIGITNPSEIAYLMCCRIPIPLDDDQKVNQSLLCLCAFVLSHFPFHYIVFVFKSFKSDANLHPRSAIFGVPRL